MLQQNVSLHFQQNIFGYIKNELSTSHVVSGANLKQTIFNGSESIITVQ